MNAYDRHAQKMEKIKCIIHYFTRVTKESKCMYSHHFNIETVSVNPYIPTQIHDED